MRLHQHPALNLSSCAQPLVRCYASWASLTLYFGQQVPALSHPSSSAHPLLIHLSLNTSFSVAVSSSLWLLSLSCCPRIEKNLDGCWGLPSVVLSIVHLFPFFQPSSMHPSLCLLFLHLHFLSPTHCWCNTQKGGFTFVHENNWTGHTAEFDQHCCLYPSLYSPAAANISLNLKLRPGSLHPTAITALLDLPDADIQ